MPPAKAGVESGLPYFHRAGTALGWISFSTSIVRAPTSGGIGASHGDARSVVCASDTPCAQRLRIVIRLNS
jgi:hypothetical protein